jgi:hypothetical protein
VRDLFDLLEWSDHVLAHKSVIHLEAFFSTCRAFPSPLATLIAPFANSCALARANCFSANFLAASVSFAVLALAASIFLEALAALALASLASLGVHPDDTIANEMMFRHAEAPFLVGTVNERLPGEEVQEPPSASPSLVRICPRVRRSGKTGTPNRPEAIQ